MVPQKNPMGFKVSGLPDQVRGQGRRVLYTVYKGSGARDIRHDSG